MIIFPSKVFQVIDNFNKDGEIGLDLFSQQKIMWLYRDKEIRGRTGGGRGQSESDYQEKERKAKRKNEQNTRQAFPSQTYLSLMSKRLIDHYYI